MPQLMECRHAFALCECGIEYRDNRGSAESFPQRSHQTRLTLDREHTLRLEPVEQRLRPVSRVRPGVNTSAQFGKNRQGQEVQSCLAQAPIFAKGQSGQTRLIRAVAQPHIRVAPYRVLADSLRSHRSSEIF